MKRTPLKRSKPLRRRNASRHRREQARQFGPLAAHVRSLPCLICGAPSQAAHVRTRRLHGAWLTHPDGTRAGNIVPLCSEHHREQHDVGIRTFEGRHGVDLARHATDIGLRLRVVTADDT